MTDELACNRDVFSPEEEQHYESLLAAWTDTIQDRHMLDNGIEFTLKDDGNLRTTLEEFIPFEQRCCPFLSFDIDQQQSSIIRFRMTGPPGTREFMLAQASSE